MPRLFVLNSLKSWGLIYKTIVRSYFTLNSMDLFPMWKFMHKSGSIKPETVWKILRTNLMLVHAHVTLWGVFSHVGVIASLN